MGRPEQPVDPQAGPVERLAWELRRLRDQAGRPSYRDLAQRAHFSRSTLAEAATGVRLPTLEATLAYATACGGDRAEWERRWHLAADELERTHRRSPYPGLFALGVDDADLFFGRGLLLEDLLKAVQRAPLTVVTGASGSGKSSLLGAGLLAKLTADGTAAKMITPGAHPSYDAGDVSVLIIDQFEEVFTLCAEAERNAFLDRLSTAVTTGEGPAVVMGVRADFYEKCVQHPGLVTAFRDSVHVPVGPMNEQELRAAVTEPAAQVGLNVDPDLVAAVLTEATDQVGALPMVAHALRETWSRQRGLSLRLIDYRSAGGVTGAIARTAEDLYTDLDEDQRELLRAVLLRMATPGEGTAAVRRRISRDELTGIEQARGRTNPAPAGDQPASKRPTTGRPGERSDSQPAGKERDTERAGGHPSNRSASRRPGTGRPGERSGSKPGGEQLGTEHAGERSVFESTGEQRDGELEGERPGTMATDRQHGAEQYGVERAGGQFGGEYAGGRPGAESTGGRGGAGRAGELDTVLERLAAARLIVLDHDTIDIAHEALITGWPRLRNWLDDDRETLLRHQRLTNDAADWERHGHGKDYLYRGERLTAWDTADFAPLNDLERSFLMACRTNADAERSGARCRKVLTIGGSSFAAVAVSVLVVLTLIQTGNAGGDRDRAESVRLAGEARRQLQQDPELALLLAIEAYEAGPTPEADIVLRQATVDARLRGSQPAGLRRVEGMAAGPDGRKVAIWGSGTAPAGLEIWNLDATTARRDRLTLPRAHTQGLTSADFSKDGTRLATGNTSGEVVLWDLATASPTVLGTVDGGVRDVSLGPDGRVATAHGDGVRIWDPDGNTEPVKLGPAARSVAFSPSGQRLAAGGDGSPLRVWLLTGDRPRLERAAPRGAPEHVAFSPAGPWAATVEGDVPQVWNVRDSRAGEWAPQVELADHAPRLNGLAFSQAGERMATFGADGLIRVWTTASDADPLVLRTPRGDPRGVAFAPGGRSLVGIDADGTLRRWDITSAEPTSARGSLLAVSADGGTTATTTDAMSITVPRSVVVQIRRPSEPTEVRGPSDAAYKVALSPDGRRMAGLGQAGTLTLWDLTTGTATSAPAGLRGLPSNLAFSSDGSRLAAGAAATEPRVWQVSADNRLTPVTGWAAPPTGKADGTVALSPDGTLLADARNDDTVVVWDLTGRSEPRIMRGHQDDITDLAFSPDGRRLAGAAADGAIRLWDPRGKGDPTTFLRGAEDSVRKLRFSPDGGWLLTNEPTGHMRLWRTTGGEPVELSGWGATGGVTAFSGDGRQITRGFSPQITGPTGLRDALTRTRACEVCGPAEQVLDLAKSRRTRTLTAEERRNHLASRG
ncbi:helix-turn-helix domain-containing protein [Spirillospora sp. NPDC047279]|uniref:nSTAND1 domain-containing NTPase n=1 Tax=Spirillospora sp. NPDC047279 TaxID=3155478 RepID=UPI0033E642A8